MEFHSLPDVCREVIFLGDVLSWLTATATTKDVTSIKQKVNQLIRNQYSQQKTLVHVFSILNVTRYATQVNRQHINIVMNAAGKTPQDVTTLYNFTHSLYSSLSYQQIVLHIWSIFANLRDSLYYLREVALHTMDYIDAATTGILPPHIQPVEDLRTMSLHIEETLPSTTHLLILSEDAIHLYRYLCTHVLIADEQLLLINVPIQDCAQQLEIYEMFNLAIPHGNFLACYNINNRYLGIIHVETKAMEISEDSFKTCQKANGQFCNLNTPLFLDLETKSSFPKDIVTTDFQPDLVIWSNTVKAVIVGEQAILWEDNIDSAHVCKRLKYTELVLECV